MKIIEYVKKERREGKEKDKVHKENEKERERITKKNN